MVFVMNNSLFYKNIFFFNAMHREKERREGGTAHSLFLPIFFKGLSLSSALPQLPSPSRSHPKSE